MANSTAAFAINGSPSTAEGYDATNGEAMTVSLEAPGADVRVVEFSFVSESPDAPTITLSPATGKPATPSGTVTFTMPAAGAHTYILQAQINGGVDIDGRVVPGWTWQRAIAIANQNGLRKIAKAENVQYSGEEGWSRAFADLVDASEIVGPVEVILGSANADTTTINATAVTVATIPIPTDESRIVSATARAHDDTAGESAAMQVTNGYKNVAGTVSALALVSNKVRDDVTWDLLLTISTTNVLVQIKGDASNSVEWKLTVEVL